MKIFLKFFTLLLIVAASLSSVSQKPQTQKHVVIISLDGVPEYLVEDTQQTMPFLTKMGHLGVHAEFMLPVNPTVTWPNHTSIATGTLAAKHQVLSNGLIEFDPATGRPHVNPEVTEPQLSHAETIYDVAHKAGLTTGEVAWPASQGAPTLTWSFGECPDMNGISAKEVIAAKIAEPAYIKGCLGGPQAWRNRLWSDAAVQMIELHKPNIMLVHILAADSIHHMYGTKGFASSYALAFDDDRIKEIVEATKRAGIFENTTFFVVSDHGHADVDKGGLHPDVLLRKAGIMTGEGKETKSAAWVESDGGMAMIFITDPAKRVDLIPKLTTLFQGQIGIDKVLSTEDALKAAGFPTHATVEHAPDMVLGAAAGYSFSGGPATEFVTPAGRMGSTHGYLNDNPKMHAIFFAWGAGIKNGIPLAPVKSIDVAPTAATLLGIKLQNADGRVLTAILK